MSAARVATEVERWVQSTIIALNLCPFAKAPLASGAVKFSVTSADTEETLLRQLSDELLCLQSEPEIETTLLIHPGVLTEFADYNQFLSRAEQLLAESGYEGVYQLASFHPDYQFAGTQAEDAENYSNRSPYPMLHLLRESSVEKAVALHPAPEQIPQRNIERLNAMGKAGLARRLADCFIS